MAESEDGFISRWSRRKREAGDEAPAQPETPEPRPAGQSAPPAPADAGAAPARPEDLPDLPDPDSLTAESDFAVFMKEGVPDVLRRRALRRLWRINPLFSHLDRLNDYDDDYTDAATVVAGLKTLYKVGRGFGDPDDDESAAAEPEAVTDDAPPPPADAPEASTRPVEDVGADPDKGADASDPPGLVESGPTAAVESSLPNSEPAAKFTGAGGVRRRGARARRWGES